jgi:cell division protein FtsQ
VLIFGSSNRRNRRRPEGKSRFRLPAIAWKRWSGVAASLLFVGCAVFGVRAALDQPIRSVTIEGRFQRVSPLDVEKVIREHSVGVGLIAVDLEELATAVRGVSWVDSARVARRWPRGLSVFVVEQVPVARWGASGLLNVRGELFVNDARHLPPELPELNGPPGSEQRLTERYLAAQGRLEEAGMRLSSLRLDPRGAWAFTLDNGVAVRLGRRQVEERFDRFMAAAARIVATRADDIDYVDLRYSNGFAIGWKGASKEGGRRG